MFIHTTKSVQSGFSKAPEALNAIDMSPTLYEFILAMIHAQVFAIADVDQPIVTTPAIRIDDATQCNTTPDNALERRLSAVWNDFCVDMAIAFKDTEDSCFTECPTATFAFDSLSAEVRFVHFDLARERRLGLAIFGNAYTEASQISVDGIAVKVSQYGDLGRVQVKCKQPDNLPKLMLADSCTDCIPVFHCHDSSLASFH